MLMLQSIFYIAYFGAVLGACARTHTQALAAEVVRKNNQKCSRKTQIRQSGQVSVYELLAGTPSDAHLLLVGWGFLGSA